jgi:dTDP-4-dehydrorhamnose reductase
MKILILGNGWLGNMLSEAYGAPILKKDINNLTPEDIEAYEAIINTAAKTSIDWCEKRENWKEAFHSNVTGALHVAKLCHEGGLHLTHISSACIFESLTPEDVKTEASVPNPQCFYAYTKMWAEELIAPYKPLIARIRLPVSFDLNAKRNTIYKLLRYSDIVDTQESVTVVEDFIEALKPLIDKGADGIYHLINEGTISPDEIATIFRHPHITIGKHTLASITADRAKRVSTIAANTKLPKLPDIQVRIRDIFNTNFPS